MLTVNYDVFFSTCASDLGGPTFKWFFKVLRLTAHNHVSLHMSLIIREIFKLKGYFKRTFFEKVSNVHAYS